MMRPSFVNVVQGVESSQSPHTVVNHAHIAVEDEVETQDVLQYNPVAIDNYMHPLYIHNHDRPGLVLIAKKLVGPDNYAPWSRSMQIALNARNKFVIVNGTFAKPAPESPLHAQWERVNDLIITWILNFVVDEISDGLNYVTTASDIWRELQERFSGISGHRVFQVMKDIHSLEQGNRSVEVYFHKLKGLWDEYTMLKPTVSCVCAAHQVLVERDQKRKLLQFLMELHESNAIVRGQILMMSPLPFVSQAYAYVKQDEKARKGYQQSVAQVHPFVNALAFNSSPASAASYHTGSKKPGLSLKCSYCNYNGHTKENCFKIIGYPPNWKKKKESLSNTQTGAFRPLSKPFQANTVVSQPALSDDQINQMQQQIAQLSQMMTFFVGTGQPFNSPEDHLAGCS